MKYLWYNHIYLARRPDGLLKLGSTSHIGNRQKTLRSKYGKRYDLLARWCLDRPVALDVELMAHAILKKFAVFGEHYDTTERRICAAVERSITEYEREHDMHGLKAARERGVIGGQKQKYTDEQIREAIKKKGSVAGAARLLDCAMITIQRRMEKWGKKGKTK